MTYSVYQNYQKLNSMAQKNSVVLFGGSLDKSIPVTEIAQSFDLNFKIYNRSVENLSIRDAKTVYLHCVEPIAPEAVLFHIGENDLELFKKNTADFDKNYLDLIAAAKQCNSKIRIGIVSLENSDSVKIVEDMNRHLKAIADSEKYDFINLNKNTLWNPNATKAVFSFISKMSIEERFNIKKPLADIADILYSYVYSDNDLQDEELQKRA